MPNMKGKNFLSCNFPDKEMCHANKNTYYSKTTLSNSYGKKSASFAIRFVILPKQSNFSQILISYLIDKCQI